MTTTRLPTELWVMAHVRRCNGQGVPAMVVRRGDRDSGMVILKINLLNRTARCYSLTRDLEGQLGWLPALEGTAQPEPDIDAYIARQAQRDPDLWVVEIEDREGRIWFDGKVL